MREAISRYPESADARMKYANMILQHGDERYYGDAERQVEELRKLAATSAQTIDLMVRVASKTGKSQQARASLLQLLPKTLDAETVKDDQLPMFEFIAALLVKLDDLENAERIYRFVAAGDPRKVFSLADFLGRYRDPDQCMELLEKSYRPEYAEATARVAIAVDRHQRDEVGDKYDDQITGWLNRAILESPDSITLQILLAEFEDLRTNYGDAAAIYQKLLSRRDLTGPPRAVVLNNLAFLIAVAGSSTEVGLDPLVLVQEAADILGPTADILDTRAVIYIVRGEHQKAIRDLVYSVTDNPNSAKYFHKAVAHLGAGENTAAIEAWEKAEELGDIRSELNRLEFDRFDEAQSKIEELRAQRRQLTDNDRSRRAS
jgi:tetratricopeptide (TPR) repeat protein